MAESQRDKAQVIRKADAQRLSAWQWRRLVWAVIVAALVVLASSRSRVASPGLSRVDDKIAHFAVYGMLATLVCRSGPGWKAAGWAVVSVSAFGALDEWHQSFVPGRSSSIADWIADTLGALLAAVLYAGWGRYRGWLEYPLWRDSRRGRAGKGGATIPASGQA